MRRWIIFFLIIFIFTPLSILRADVSVLFLIYNMGEGEPFRKVAEKLTVDYKIVGIGVGAEQFKDDAHFVYLNSDLYSEARVNVAPHDKDHNRNRLLKSEIVQAILDLGPKVVISGMSSAWQAQVLNSLHERKIPTIAFYDNMNGRLVDQEYVKPFLAELQNGAVSTWLIPGEAYKSGFDGNIIVSGNPTLEQWDEAFERSDARILKRLDLKPGQKLLLFAGGNDTTYPQYLNEMVKAVKRRKDLLLVITPHPARKDNIENKIFKKNGHPENVKIVKDMKTLDIAPFASIFAVHKSGMAAHALSHGLPVLFVGPKKDYKSLLVVGKGLGIVAENKKEAQHAINKLLHTSEKPSLNALGVPEQASQRIAEYLNSFISKKTSERSHSEK
ncbi:Glycosyltransferase family protein [Candidatus Bealeia paramacronuclearis]|uniref:Glycosyltransferase family protein n=1 Tax=Candidatus Bealeia paramacronuclearis TaxID=1921001 RepID=A0ABZ2C1Z4_9PROT|nr:Glycosyltransferase family protein [Candidatus Bealeia paramacronuclearis]